MYKKAVATFPFYLRNKIDDLLWKIIKEHTMNQLFSFLWETKKNGDYDNLMERSGEAECLKLSRVALCRHACWLSRLFLDQHRQMVLNKSAARYKFAS